MCNEREKGCFTTFVKANTIIRIALAGLAEEDELSEEVLSGSEDFLCYVFCPSGVHNGQAKQIIFWFFFKELRDEHGVNKLTSIQGTWIECIRRVHTLLIHGARMWYSTQLVLTL